MSTIETYAQIINDGGYQTIVELRKRLKPSDIRLMALCGEFFCNLAHNVTVAQLPFDNRIVEELVFIGSHLEGDKVFLHRLSRSLVNLSMAEEGIEMIVGSVDCTFYRGGIQ